QKSFDGYVALGSVTGPAHIADVFYTETMRGLMSLGATGVALGQGIVRAGDEGAALDLAVTHDIGGDAARACLALAGFGERLGYMPCLILDLTPSGFSFRSVAPLPFTR